MARTTFSGPVRSLNGFLLEPVEIASLPEPSTDLKSLGTPGTVMFASNANGGAGALVYSNGEDWIDSSTGEPVAEAPNPDPDPDPED